MKQILVFSLAISCFLYTTAQQPWDQLDQWGRRQPIQKVHLHFDKENYIAGETAWFKAYLVSDYMPDTISTTLYVELMGSDTAILCRKVLPVLLGSTSGQLEIPDSLISGTYTVRAYTRTMKDLSPDFPFRKGVYVFGKKETRIVTPPRKTIYYFFPEGGNLVAGFSNNVAFKAVFENGFPAPVNAVIRNSKGESVATLSDYHDGMGMFELNPQPGEKYYAAAGDEKYYLPDPVEKGVTVNMIQHEKGFFYELQQPPNDLVYNVAYLVGQMQHRVVFSQELKPGSSSLQGIVNTKQLRSGIIQVTFFNKNGIPLAERLWFNNNHEYIQQADILTDTVNLKARGRNRFRIALPDTVEGNISVSVVDADYESSVHRSENIISNLLLTADLKGYVHQPYYYFSADNDSVRTATDLLMMTNGWRRFNWKEISRLKDLKTFNPAYITLEGRATLRGTNRPFDNKSLLLMINNVKGEKKRASHFLQTDRDGNFLIDSLLFFDRSVLLFSDVRGKKSLFIDVKLKGDSLHRAFVFSNFAKTPANPFTGAGSQWQMDYESILKENGVMLEGITLKVQKKSPMELIDEKYTSGLFNGDASKAIDLVNTDEALSYANIFDYLQFRVNGLQVSGDGIDYSVVYRQMASASSMGVIPMTLFLDEVETEASVIATIPASQVALVKMYSTFAGAWGNAPGGVLAIYTKKADDYGKSGSYNNVLLYNGYSIVREFFAPDYKKPVTNDKPDNRITLDWRPTIFINSINPRIPVSFYNNDRTKKYKIIVEGMTSSGKMIWLEKIVNGK